MDVGETFQDDFKTPSSSQTLFPLSSTSIKELEKHTLFPVGSEPTALPNEDTGGGGLDWLSNPSYGDAAVASVVELQEAIAEHHAASVQSENRCSNAARETSEGGSDDKESQGTADPGDEGPARHSRQKAKHKHKHKKNKVKKKELAVSSRVGSQLSEKVTVSTKKVFIEEMSGLEPEDAFRIDRKRDKDLWTYECLFKAHIAGYRRLGHSALGLQGNLDLFKHEKNSSKKAEAVRYCQKRSRALLRKVGEKVRHVDREAGQVQYIPLGGVTDTATDPLRVLDEATRQYVQGRGTEEAGETEETQLDDEILQQVARYNKNLRENTSDVKLWLEFVKFQDQVFRGDSWRRGGLSQAVIDKKLAILERALSDNPGCLDLKLAQLEVCEDVWGTERLAQEWDQLLFVHSANTKLWHSYLLYQQSRLTSFSVPKLIKLYHKCFRVLTAVVEGNMQTARPTDVPDSALMDVFVQYCMFLHQVGHTERAVASYQAIIEFNLFCPPNLTDTMTGDRAAVFESFWDSSIARFGEPGAAGWGAWRSRDKMVAETGGVTADPTEEAEEAIISKQMPTWKTWLEIETLRENSHWLPWRPDLSKNETEEDCEDLERLVLVDDITPVLFRVAEPEAQFRLVLCLLRQLGVATWDVLSQLCLQQQEGTSASSMQLSLHKMCQLPWLPAARSPDLEGADDQSETLQRFIHQTLAQAVRVFRGQSQTVFTLLLIQTEWRKHGVDSPRDLPKHKSKVLRKFVKNLLKEGHNRNNLTVWNAYACLEHELGRNQDAVGVVETALAMFSGGSSEDKSGLCLLYQTYCQLLLHVTQHLHADLTQKQIDVSQQQKTRLMFCLTSLAEGTKFQLLKEPPLTTSTMLRTRRKLKTQVTDLARTLCKAESAHGEGNTRVFHHLLSQLNCLAMFELCSSGLEAAMSNYQDVLLLLDGSKSSAPSQPLVAVRENIYRSQWILLRHQMSVGAVPLSQLRVVIDRALQEFPDSSAFLQCLVDLEARSHIVGRLRRYMDRALVNPASPVPLLHTVLVEVVRLTSLQQVAQTDSYSTTGVMHRVRSVLERGTQSSASQHCPLVWRLYSHVESKFGDRERAKGIFYRALQQCPWSKVLYKDGVRLFGQSQLQEMVDLMTEKELRVQIPVEELDLLCQSDPVPHSPQEEEMVEV
ncbi:nuclear exosome regulator NRDE2-like [Haliotis rufescens]|uniref:nuclear exosome regulator NRDE2-like n=1 Tax=Haliotis rufescens TaxID=6454 RepID=UPI00201F7806|nr:nuclear exosome regulator NRDE2-like [Haliotis rufescens]